MLYCSAGMVDHAVRTFNQMEHHNSCPRTEKSLCAVLSVYLDNKMYDKFHETFESVPPKIGVSPGVKSYNLVLRAFCEEKRVESARELLDKIGNEANIDSYNILLGAVGNWVEFDGIVKELLKKGLEPNLTTYNHRILRLCKNKECVRAKKLLDEMVSKGVKPNSASYDALIFGFCKVGDLESARKVLEGDGFVSPPSFAYYTLLRHMVEEGEFESALEMCKEIIRRKWVPPFEAMRGLVTGLIERSKAEEAKEVVDKMKKRLRGPALDSWQQIEAALPL
uniref:Pentatricopeptide repeat-containing protein n=2 Tax=Davidia involucrata TaxID=16924 RepID=A0A5B7A503_DAVIN